MTTVSRPRDRNKRKYLLHQQHVPKELLNRFSSISIFNHDSNITAVTHLNQSLIIHEQEVLINADPKK